jgi:murein DD-endopeptidase MepM/ murein hydrolase activator NlpD
LNIITVMLTTLAAAQGEAIQLTQPDEPGLAGIEAAWRDRRVPFVRGDNGWFTVIGVDLDAEPGAHRVEVFFSFADGRTRSQTEVVEVQGKDFPTTRLTVEPKYVELSEENQARAAREREEISAIYARLTPEAFWTRPFDVPIPGTTGGRNFGHRRVFNEQPRNPHSGADLKATTGTQVFAANRGRVVLAKNLFFSGNAVFIDHGLGIHTVYLHLSEILVEPGAMVGRGELVGLAGATGRVTGPHLHWGVRVLDARVDPFSLLSLGD